MGLMISAQVAARTRAKGGQEEEAEEEEEEEEARSSGAKSASPTWRTQQRCARFQAPAEAAGPSQAPGNRWGEVFPGRKRREKAERRRRRLSGAKRNRGTPCALLSPAFWRSREGCTQLWSASGALVVGGNGGEAAWPGGFLDSRPAKTGWGGGGGSWQGRLKSMMRSRPKQCATPRNKKNANGASNET